MSPLREGAAQVLVLLKNSELGLKGTYIRRFSHCHDAKTSGLSLQDLASVATLALTDGFWLPCITALHQHNQTTFKSELLSLHKAVLHCVDVLVQANIGWLRNLCIEIHCSIKHAFGHLQEMS